MKYYELTDRLDSDFSALVARFESIYRPGGCRECSSIPAGSGPPETLAVENIVRRAAISSTSWGFGIISTALLELLGEFAAENLRFGNLIDSQGNRVETFRTFAGVEEIILRGNEHSEHRVCCKCGAMIYTYLPRGEPYVTERQVANSRHIYENGMQLIVSDSVRERIGKQWSDVLKFYEVPVLSVPLDGLPADLPYWPTQEQLADYKPNLGKWRKKQQ